MFLRRIDESKWATHVSRMEDDIKNKTAEYSGSAWYVYMVRCDDGTLYTGITKNVADRILKHNTGKGARYTRTRRPVVLVYLEPAENKGVALRREYAIKQLSAKEKRRLLAQNKTEKDIP